MSIKTMLKNNVARLIGQCKGIMRMYEDNRKCADILVQLSAIASSINTCSKKIFDFHIEECLTVLENPKRELDELKAMLATINTSAEEGTLEDVIHALERSQDGDDCIDILQEFRHAYAIVIYNAGALFSHHLSHVILSDTDGSASAELKEMTNLYFKMLK